MNSKSRRLAVNTIASLLMLILIATAYTVSPFISTARADPADLVGTWLGQGTYDTGSLQPFDMVLSIFPFNGNSFGANPPNGNPPNQDVLTEQIYHTKVYVTGTFDGSTVNFTDNEGPVSGNGIALNCTYTGTITKTVTSTGPQMTITDGRWSYPIASLGGGSFTLSKEPGGPAP